MKTPTFRSRRGLPFWAGVLIPVALIAGAPLVCAQDADGDLLADGVDPFPLDPFNGGWQLLPGAGGTGPMHRHEGDACRVGNQIIVFGGRETSVVEFYDPATNLWTKSADAPLPFHHAQAVVLNGLIYFIGAFVGPYPDETPVPNIYIYNPAPRTWTQGPLIPADRRRGAAAAAAYGGKIYIAGGNTLGHKAGWVGWFDEFDPVTGSWKRLADAPQPRDHHRAIVVENRLYLLSGRRSSHGSSQGVTGNTIAEVEVYDFLSSAWTTLPNQIPTPRAGCGVVAHGRDLFVIAGENPNGALDQVEALDVVSGNWRSFPGLIQKRNGPVAVSFGNKLYVSGGQSPVNASQEVLLLPPRPLPVEPCSIGTLPGGAALQLVKAVNCGGASAGSFQIDAQFAGGAAQTSGAPIAEAAYAPEAVYKTQRAGQFSYQFAGLETQACYRLEFHFADWSSTTAGERTFDVMVNGQPVLSDFDVFLEAVGRAKALTRVFTVRPLPEGTIQVQFQPKAGQAVLNGLVLSRVIPYPPGKTAFSLSRPFDFLARVGDPVAFGSVPSGKVPASYQWRRNGVAVRNATAAVHRINAVSLAHAGDYSVVGNGTVASASGRLIVLGEPEFSPSVASGNATTLRIPFAGTGAVFQWQKDGVALTDTALRSGSRTPQLLIKSFKASDVGIYSCLVRAFGDSELLGPCGVRLMQIPGLINAEPPDGILIHPFQWQLSASEEPATFAVTGLPSGLRYDAKSRRVLGTPRKSGFFTITVTPRNAAGAGAPQVYTARIEPVPVAFRGTWVGLAEREGTVNGGLGGSVSVTVTGTGAVSGRLRSGTMVSAFSGRLNGPPGGAATLRRTFPRGRSAPLVLTLTFSRNGEPVTGTMTVGLASSPVLARRARALPLPAAAASSTSLNCLLRLADGAEIGDDSVPQGTGWMRLTRSVASGRIGISGAGRLSDGQPVSFAFPECEAGELPIHAILSGAHGSVLGWGALAETAPRRHEFAGNLHWRKLRGATATDFAYRSGVDVNLMATGLTYVRPPAGVTFLGHADAPKNAAITFLHGGLEGAAQAGQLNQVFRLTATPGAVFSGAAGNPAGVSLRIQANTGGFTGAFRLRDGAVIRDVRFQGLFSGSEGEGFFTLRALPAGRTSPVLSGLVRISAP